MAKYGISKSIFNKDQAKIAKTVFEIFLFIVALVFLAPVFLAFINSFKSNSEVQMNVASLPRLSIKVPKKMRQSYFEGMIINRLTSQEEKTFFGSFYELKEAEYKLLGKKTERLKKIESTYGITLNAVENWRVFNVDVLQKINNDAVKKEVKDTYRFYDGVYFLKKGEISSADRARLISILRTNNIFRTAKENFVINYGESWKQTKFHKVFFNTLIITIISMLGIIVISSMAAYALVRTKTRISWLVFLIFTFAMVVPFQAIMFPLVKTAKALDILGTMHGIILIYMGVGCPMAIFMYHGFIKGVPMELEESAALDGAGQFTIFFKIVLPLLTPITATIAILDVLWLWNDFLLPLIILVKKVVTIQLAQYYTRGAYSRDFGLELASLVLASFPVVIFYLIMQKYIIKGITAGAVKG